MRSCCLLLGGTIGGHEFTRGEPELPTDPGKATLTQNSHYPNRWLHSSFLFASIALILQMTKIPRPALGQKAYILNSPRPHGATDS
ncbi:Uncharacterized protein HZ326_8970 [Fusarium oxysporum f. sp. albedinis]|nr:Uncharacterized protein HZ326_8970 [Fusarium oxysporum f. sp. albedinis]